MISETEYQEIPIELIINEYANTVYRLAYARTKNRADAEDLLQEVFIRCFNSKVKFNSQEHCKAWLIRTTINCSKNLLSSAWFRKTVPIRDSLLELSYTPEEGKSEVFYAVLDLPEKYRIIIHLYYYEELSVAEISKLLNRKESTIKTQLFRARKILKQNLKEEYDYVWKTV